MSTIDLSQLPAPELVEELSATAIRDEILADLQSRDPDIDPTPSDPLYRLIEVCAYRELLIRQRVNEAAIQQMAAFATDTNLDHIGVTYYHTARLVIDPGDPDAVPPVDPTYESDDDYRDRFLLSDDSVSTAGGLSSYRYLAMSADGNVKDVSVSSPDPVEVLITVLSKVGDGTASEALLDAVEAALDDDVRPFTDQVTVQSASIITYSIVAALYVYSGVESETVRSAAEDAITEFVAESHRVGRDITLAGVMGALMVTGVHDIELSAPGMVATIEVDVDEAAYCESIEVTVGGVVDE